MKKLIDLPSEHWVWLQETYGNDVDSAVKQALEHLNPELKTALVVRSKTEKILYLLQAGLKTSSSLSEHLPQMQRGVITAMLNQMQHYGYVEIDRNEWPRVYTITEKGKKKLAK